MSREQALVNLCFELVYAATAERNRAFFEKASTEEKMKWVAEKLKGCGFETVPMGSSWGVLK